jgi:hypothetical protein
MRLRYLAAAVVAGALAALAISSALAMVSGSSARGPFFAVMTGKKEVSPSGKKGVGDKNGRGGFTAVIDGGQLCFGIVVKNLSTPVAAHIHKGSPKVAGPIKLPLTPPTSGNPGASSGCVSIGSKLARRIRKNPRKYYVNVHTTDFPGGAIRGQLFAKTK